LSDEIVRLAQSRRLLPQPTLRPTSSQHANLDFAALANAVGDQMEHGKTMLIEAMINHELRAHFSEMR
jgi:hypothetical protein